MSGLTGVWTVYQLADPTTHTVRWVGRTGRSVTRRLAEHLSPMSTWSYRSGRPWNPAFASWLRDLKAQGLRPWLVVSNRVTDWNDAVRIEAELIDYLRTNGGELPNVACGTRMSQATKDKLSAANNGKPHGGRVCKLTDDQVREIYSAQGLQRLIASRFGIRQQTVSKIKRGQSRADVTGATRPGPKPAA
jgi:hypothetical protein